MSIRGAGIKQVLKTACEAANTLNKDSLLILEGGCNSLNTLGTDCTVQAIMESVKNIKYLCKDVSVAEMGIFPRPRGGRRYKEMRRDANKKLQRELYELKLSLFKVKGGNASFIDMNAVVSPDSFASYGVHLNVDGEVKLWRRVLNWIKKKKRCQEFQ